MELHWFLPLSQDVSHIGMWPEEGPAPILDYLVAIAAGAEQAGFRGLLVPAAYVTWLETFTASAAVLARTSHAQLMLAVRPNQIHPAQAAKMVVSLQLLFPDRIRLNVTSGGWSEDKWIGNFDDRDRRYRRLWEWLEAVNQIWYGDHPVDYAGDVYRFEGTRLIRRADGRVPIAMSGSSPEARAALVRFGDSYLLFAAPPAEVAAEIERLRSTPGFRPSVTVGLRAHVIVRPTEAEAWGAANDLISRVDPRIREQMDAQASHEPSQRAAQQRLAGSDDLVVSPNLWAGVGTARYGVATAIVGDPEQVADRLVEYTKLGVGFFILSGYPKLEEVHRFGELVTPVLRDRGMLET